MNNFLEFIEEDIQSKKTLITTLPKATKTNIKKLNEKVKTFSEKYEEYKVAIAKYLEMKSKSFEVSADTNEEAIDANLESFERVRFILNPINTYFEKMGFDTLFYQINNYRDFKFNSLNDIINEFLNKFESAGIKLTIEDFNYTCYVREFMSVFLEARISQEYDRVSEVFERIYWVNPEIIEHIELNFRKLIKKYEKTFIEYINKLKQEAMVNSSYELCLEKLTDIYREMNNKSNESIKDIIDLAKEGAFDINNYFEDSKIRTTTFNSLMIDQINIYDKEILDKFCETLRKLKLNVEEFASYAKFIPLIDDFKVEFLKSVSIETTDKKNDKKGEKRTGLKAIESQINDGEAKLEKINKKIFGGKIKFLEKNENEIKKLKFEATKKANELHNLYIEYDREYFKEKVMSVVHGTFTVADFLHLYYSFDYFKKTAIKRVYGINNYNEIIEYSDSFDLFAMNPLNVIVRGILLNEENNIAKVIVNKYRLININIAEENLNPDDIKLLLEKIELILRIHEIENSDTTVEKIWFMVAVEKLLNPKEA